MPEGPELRKSRDDLQFLVGRYITRVEAVGGRYAKVPPVGLNDFTGSSKCAECLYLKEYGRIEEVEVKGKFMWWSIRAAWSLWCTYGMTGRWSTTRDDKHCAVVLTHRGAAGDEACVYFNDPRHFGTLKFVYDRDGDKTQAKLDALGPDMLGSPPAPEQFIARLGKKPNRTLAEALMDQSVVSGVGNYVKAEGLYMAALSPHRTVAECSVAELMHLGTRLTQVMMESYTSGGATISTYRTVDGTKGGAQRRFAVYGNMTDPMGHPVIKEATKDGRTTHWCPAIQK